MNWTVVFHLSSLGGHSINYTVPDQLLRDVFKSFCGIFMLSEKSGTTYT